MEDQDEYFEINDGGITNPSNVVTFNLENIFNSIKLNYKCPKGTVDESNRCPEGGNANISVKSERTEKVFKDRSRSLFQVPTGSKRGENSKYLKSLDEYLVVHNKFNEFNEARTQLNREYDKKFDDLRRSFGYDPENPEDYIKQMDDKEFNEVHDKLVVEFHDKTITIEKEMNHYRSKIDESHSKMVKDYADEHRRTDPYDASPVTHGHQITDSVIYDYDTMKIVKDKKSNLDPDEVFFKIKSMPQTLSSSIGKVELLGYDNPDNKFWEEKTGMIGFAADGCAGSGKMSFFKQGSIDNGLLAHEAAHLLDDRFGNFGDKHLGQDPEKFYYFSDNAENRDDPKENPTWQDAIVADNQLPQKYELSGYVSEYAKIHGLSKKVGEGHQKRREDFADSMKGYMVDHDKFIKQFPNRAKILDKFLKDDIDYRESEMVNRIRGAIK